MVEELEIDSYKRRKKGGKRKVEIVRAHTRRGKKPRHKWIIDMLNKT